MRECEAAQMQLENADESALSLSNFSSQQTTPLNQCGSTSRAATACGIWIRRSPGRCHAEELALALQLCVCIKALQF
eukprot:4709-Heterococcus_DN1.PRE.1